MKDVITIIPDVLAWVRLPKGVFKQVKMYHRGDKLFLQHGQGYIEVRGKCTDGRGTVATTHPDVVIVDADFESFSWHVDERGVTRYGSKQ